MGSINRGIIEPDNKSLMHVRSAFEHFSLIKMKLKLNNRMEIMIAKSSDKRTAHINKMEYRMICCTLRATKTAIIKSEIPTNEKKLSPISS